MKREGVCVNTLSNPGAGVFGGKAALVGKRNSKRLLKLPKKRNGEKEKKRKVLLLWLLEGASEVRPQKKKRVRCLV